MKKYIQKLKDRNILVLPLEEYKGVHTKILHKCICGNEWEVSPNNVYGNAKCGCIIKSKTSTNEQYLEKLKEKNIKVAPLENYINSTTKILHKCICGNEWNIIPSAILKGNLCGCNLIQYNQTNTNEWYLEKLKEKNIKVIPLETYIKSETKILHKCYCNNEWLGRPMDVLKGMGCGCKRNYSLRGVEFYKNKKTTCAAYTN